ncbi:single-stranded DNA-binding protein [Canibacter zhoujuaniae]|uniref:single-stranded DNA-binding protein n=1 Tax=Canibacter zhoujuaniae TaxID=2708343 RepID=UPI00141EFFE6|nr:single-stranded DNA-binding protein [Canibacter zhoujuaniae]
MSAHVTVVGTVANIPRVFKFANGSSKTSFRIAESERRWNRATAKWVETETNWYTVNVPGNFGINVSESISKGNRIIVTGKLRTRQWETEQGQRGISVEIDADGFGLDLRFGISRFTRVVRSEHLDAGSEAHDNHAAEQPGSSENFASHPLEAQSEETVTEQAEPIAA